MAAEAAVSKEEASVSTTYHAPHSPSSIRKPQARAVSAVLPIFLWSCTTIPPRDLTLELRSVPSEPRAMEPVTLTASAAEGAADLSYVWELQILRGRMVSPEDWPAAMVDRLKFDPVALGPEATLVFPAPGEYRMGVLATDGRGRTWVAATFISVAPRGYRPHAPVILENQTFPEDAPRVIEGLEISDAGATGILLVNCENVIVRDCLIHDCALGLHADGCRSLRIERCRFTTNTRGLLIEGRPAAPARDIAVVDSVIGQSLCGDALALRFVDHAEVSGVMVGFNGKSLQERTSGIACSGLFRNVSIHDNFIVQSNDDGIELSGTPAFGPSAGIHVYRNTIKDNGEHGLFVSHVTDAGIHHNLVVGSHNDGVRFEGVSTASIDHNLIVDNGLMRQKRFPGSAVSLLGSAGCAVEHNVLAGSSAAGVALGSYRPPAHDAPSPPIPSRDTLIRHNIIVNNGGGNVDVAPGTEGTILSYNNVWQRGEAPDYRGCTPGRGDISEPPDFRNEIFGDFTLHDASPCRAAGDPAVRNPDGSRPDLGIGGPPLSFGSDGSRGR